MSCPTSLFQLLDGREGTRSLRTALSYSSCSALGNGPLSSLCARTHPRGCAIAIPKKGGNSFLGNFPMASFCSPLNNSHILCQFWTLAHGSYLGILIDSLPPVAAAPLGNSSMDICFISVSVCGSFLQAQMQIPILYLCRALNINAGVFPCIPCTMRSSGLESLHFLVVNHAK